MKTVKSIPVGAKATDEHGHQYSLYCIDGVGRWLRKYTQEELEQEEADYYAEHGFHTPFAKGFWD